jgi:hypothetical protein
VWQLLWLVSQDAELWYLWARHIRVPDAEFALHNGKDLPVMLKHEVNPILAYATADAFTEVSL